MSTNNFIINKLRHERMYVCNFFFGHVNVTNLPTTKTERHIKFIFMICKKTLETHLNCCKSNSYHNTADPIPYDDGELNNPTSNGKTNIRRQ